MRTSRILTSSLPRGFALSMVFALAPLALGACSDSPTDPGGDESGPAFTDVPDIPEPASPGGDVPSTSETVTRIEPYTGNFSALVLDAYGAWSGERTGAFSCEVEVDGELDWVRNRFPELLWNSLAAEVRQWHVLVDSSGERPPLSASDTSYPPTCAGFQFSAFEGDFEGGTFDADLFLRRDRHWVLRPLEGSAGDYLLVYPQTSGEIATSYSSGSERTETQEFGQSVTGTVGLGFGPASASVSATLSATFSSSVTVSESTTETFTKTVTGRDGTVIQFMVWELVESYAFCDADGEPIESDTMTLDVPSMERRGAAIALQSTEFPLDSVR